MWQIGRYGGSSLMTFVCHNMPEISLQTCLQNYDKNNFQYHFTFARGFNASWLMKSKSSVSFAWICYHILTNTKRKENNRPGTTRESGEGALTDCHSTTHDNEVSQNQALDKHTGSHGNNCLIYSWGIHTHAECNFKMALNFSMMAFSPYFIKDTHLLLQVTMQL